MQRTKHIINCYPIKHSFSHNASWSVVQSGSSDRFAPLVVHGRKMTPKDIQHGCTFHNPREGGTYVRDTSRDGQYMGSGFPYGTLAADGGPGGLYDFYADVEVEHGDRKGNCPKCASQATGSLFFAKDAWAVPNTVKSAASKVDRGLGKECKHCKRPNPVDKNGQLVCWWCCRNT